MKKEKEFRVFSTINTDEESRSIHGFIPYDSASEDMGFTEYIEKGAFTKTLRESKDIKCLWNHDGAQLLARTKNNSLVFEDGIDGLRFSFEAPHTTLGDDVLEMVRSGLATGISFGFNAIRDEWRSGGRERHLKECRLFEVSVLSEDPAYPDTQVYCRSLSESLKEKETLDDADYASVREEIDKLQAMLPKEPEPAVEPTTDPEPLVQEVTDQPEDNTEQLQALMERLKVAEEKLNRNFNYEYQRT